MQLMRNMEMGKRRQRFDKVDQYKQSFQHLPLDELKEVQEACYYGRRRKEAAIAVRQLIKEKQAEERYSQKEPDTDIKDEN